MNYQEYRGAIFKMWDIIRDENFSYCIEELDEKEFVLCGLCNPSLNAMVRTEKQPCPFDTRSEKDIDDRPCMDSCQIFLKRSETQALKGLPAHKVKIIMSKFITKFVTKEGIESLKSLAKACRGQKGVSQSAAEEFVSIAEKVASSTERFGGFEFSITDGKLKAVKKQ